MGLPKILRPLFIQIWTRFKLQMPQLVDCSNNTSRIKEVNMPAIK